MTQAGRITLTKASCNNSRVAGENPPLRYNRNLLRDIHDLAPACDYSRRRSVVRRCEWCGLGRAGHIADAPGSSAASTRSELSQGFKPLRNWISSSRLRAARIGRQVRIIGSGGTTTEILGIFLQRRDSAGTVYKIAAQKGASRL